MAASSSLRSCTLQIPTELPRLAGLANTGYFSVFSISRRTFLGSLSHCERSTVTCFTISNPAWRKRRFMTSLSMPAAEPSTPAPT